MYTKNDLKNQLAHMGITSSDTVIIHTSFKAVGEVKGGPEAFIDAFCEYLSDGLFLVPTQTWANVTKKSPIYDPRTSEPCIGLIPRTAYKREVRQPFCLFSPLGMVWITTSCTILQTSACSSSRTQNVFVTCTV